ncbi:competence protein ComEA [Thiomicrospira sp. WB1]|nr:ComEA family DNA-binding protein [Thiomicrospira sp. WB1]KUJ71571.1 competence protein ComEA [Thiomicrospira sp. WB1]
MITFLFASLVSFSVWAGSVNVNEASASELAQLNGIGKVKAERIVAYREANGEFDEAQDLLSVKGIGTKTLAKNRDRIEVE